MAGLGGCPRYSPGPNQYTEAQQARRAWALRATARWQRLRGRPPVDVLLTHAPAAGHGDGPDPAHHGFAALPALVAALAPGVMLHGHVLPHESTTGGRSLGRTEVRNVTGRHLLDISPGPPARTPGTPGSRAEAIVPDTGFPRSDVENDFERARRRQVLARLAQRLRREPDDVNLILPFDEVVAALGRRGERSARAADDPAGSPSLARVDTQPGLRPPVPAHVEPASASGGSGWPWPSGGRESMPPINVYQVGDLYFVRDGHHRVSIALAIGHTVIDAYVTEVLTAAARRRHPHRGDLVVKGYERLVPAARAAARRDYAQASRSATRGTTPSSARASRPGPSGSCRTSARFMDRAELARRWYRRGVPAGRARCSTTPTSSAAAPRPRPTCASRATATGSSARTSGATRSIAPPATRPGRPAPSAWPIRPRLVAAFFVQRQVLAGVRVEDVHLAQRRPTVRRPGPP